MPLWTVSAITANVSTAWERGFSSYWAGRGKDASTLLKEIDDILRNTDTLLEHHKALLDPGEYADFRAQHRTYYLKWSDEQQRHENTSDETLQRSRTPSEIMVAKENSQARANDLLRVVKTYRSTLIEASHNATLGSSPAFPDEEPTSVDPPPAQSPMPIPPQAAVVPPSRSSSPPRVPKISILPTNPEPYVLEAGKVDIDEPTLTAVCILVAKRMFDPDMFQKTIEELKGEID
ncbi:hypothetical protein FRC07_014880 [Ceratobasidium sp. 392]|nr:hypothetical protein FRC07_014880 [Ceratobasidium sp. 392]